MCDLIILSALGSAGPSPILLLHPPTHLAQAQGGAPKPESVYKAKGAPMEGSGGISIAAYEGKRRMLVPKKRWFFPTIHILRGVLFILSPHHC